MGATRLNGFTENMKKYLNGCAGIYYTPHGQKVPNKTGKWITKKNEDTKKTENVENNISQK